MQNWSFLNSKQKSTILLSGSEGYQQNEVKNIYQEIFHSEVNNFDKIANPDFFQISKNDFGKNSIPVDELRHWLTLNNFQPFQYEKKLFVIWNSEDLETEGQNTLLKILEEHHSNSVFVLTTTNLNLLLPTILSRCQIYDELNQKKSIINLFSDFDFSNRSKLNEKVEEILKITNSAKKWNEAKEFLNAMIYYTKIHFKSTDKYTKIEELLVLIEYSELYVNLKLILYNAAQIL